jgi:alanyl-tRNA synthetase
VVHVGKLKKGNIRVGEEVESSVDSTSRIPTAKNHTFTHVLNYALRKVLGNSVDQKGSLVDADKLRFDFSYNGPLSTQQLEAIQQISDDLISRNLPVFR